MKKMNSRIYDLAYEIKKAKPWKKLSNTQIFAVKHSDGTLSWVSIMGHAGIAEGFTIYLGDEGLCVLLDIINMVSIDTMTNREIANRENGIWLKFDSFSSVDRKNQELINQYWKDKGKQIRGTKMYPSIARCRPGRLSIPYIEPEVEMNFIEAMEAMLFIHAQLKGNDPAQLGFTADFSRGITIPMAVVKEGGFELDSIVVPNVPAAAYPIGRTHDDITPARVRKTRSTDEQWGLRVFSAFGTYEDPEGGAPIVPYTLLILDEVNEQIINANVIEQIDDYADTCVQMLCDAIFEFGKPQKIIVSDPRTEQCFSDFARRVGLNMECVEKDEAMLGCIAEMADFMGMGHLFEGEFDDDEYDYFNDEDMEDLDEENPPVSFDQMIALLRTPGFVSTLPDEFLNSMIDIVNEPDVPKDIAIIIKKELKKRGMI